jgi:hypothetical protein
VYCIVCGHKLTASARHQPLVKPVLIHPLSTVQQEAIDIFGLEPSLHESFDGFGVEPLTGIDVDTNEPVVSRSMNLDSTFDDRNPATEARFTWKGCFARFEDIGLSLFRHLEMNTDLVQEFIAFIQIATDVEIAAKAVKDELETPWSI